MAVPAEEIAMATTPTPKEEDGTVPHPGGAPAKTGGGGFSGGHVPDAPPPEGDTQKKKA
jgi:hypothetical protein